MLLAWYAGMRAALCSVHLVVKTKRLDAGALSQTSSSLPMAALVAATLDCLDRLVLHRALVLVAEGHKWARRVSQVFPGCFGIRTGVRVALLSLS